ncbi:hypothetical protein, partial [Marinobacter sp. bablab_jr003]
CERACRLDSDMAYHSSVGCDLGGDQPTGYATPSACFHTPEITITLYIFKKPEFLPTVGALCHKNILFFLSFDETKLQRFLKNLKVAKTNQNLSL